MCVSHLLTNWNQKCYENSSTRTQPEQTMRKQTERDTENYSGSGKTPTSTLQRQSYFRSRLYRDYNRVLNHYPGNKQPCSSTQNSPRMIFLIPLLLNPHETEIGITNSTIITSTIYITTHLGYTSAPVTL